MSDFTKEQKTPGRPKKPSEKVKVKRGSVTIFRTEDEAQAMKKDGWEIVKD